MEISSFTSIFLIGGFFVALFIWSNYAMKKRKEALAAILTQLGFAVAPASLPPEQLPLPGLELFTRGRQQQCRNVGRLKLSDEEFVFFDYSYTTGSGKNRHSHLCSCLVRVAKLQLPEFSLAPEDVFSRIAQAVGYHDIDFSYDEEFSANFVLRGKDEQRIRALFTPEIMQQLKHSKRVRIQAAGERIVAYTTTQLPEDQLSQWIQTTQALLRRFVG